MRYLIIVAFVISTGLLACGFLMDVEYSEKLIGFGVVGLFLFAFPLFAYYRWKGKNIKDYMLTKENLEKMRENQRN